MHGYWIQKWVLISCIGNLAGPTSRVAIDIESQINSGVYTYVLWVNDSNKRKNIGTLIWRIWIKFKMATDDMFFVIVIEDIYMVRKHSLVYLNMHMLLPCQPVIKFDSWYPMFTI